ncbi:hypothetical protein ACNKHM_04720 [Shigella sonnei]
MQKQRDYVTANSARLESHYNCCKKRKQQAPDFNRKTAQEAVPPVKPHVFRLIRW